MTLTDKMLTDIWEQHEDQPLGVRLQRIAQAGRMDGAKATKIIIRPWMDGMSGSEPRVSFKEWCDAVDSLFPAKTE